ncbi:MAG: hypothetical protein QNL71_08495 [Akkermansiaceae bacterium]
MASETHIDRTFSSGSFQEPPPFNSKARLIVSDNGAGIFLQIGDLAAKPENIEAINLGADGARGLICALKNALDNIGE